MTFKLDQFVNEEQVARWNKYLSEVPMLKSAIEVIQKINSTGAHALIVGGCVRDIILGTNPHDIDIATNASMETLLKTFPKVYDIGKSKDFGIVVVKHGGFDFEVAQYRQDGKYLDGRRPESVQVCQDFKGDASRRDFCINAMAIDSEGNIIDYFDGQKDIKNKIIRTVGNPHDRFQEDYLRMMRAVRFSSKLGFSIDPHTKSAVQTHAHNIVHISAERIKEELMKMAGQTGDKFAHAIQTLDDVGILDKILPEIARLKEFQHNVQHHPEGNVFQHVLSALRANKVADPIVNLSILLHDIGKSVTYKQVDGNHTYHGHDTAPEAVELINDIARKLRMTNDEKDAVLFVMSNHMKFHKLPEMKNSKILGLIKNKHFETLKAASYADQAARLGLFNQMEWQKILDKVAEVEAKWGNVAANRVGSLISGERVMKLTGLPPGKKVGAIIKYVTDEMLTHDIKDEKEIDALVIRASFKVKV